jgi:putative colanic acid biosynthesis UDP-glucose lipid carrier transferase
MAAWLGFPGKVPFLRRSDALVFKVFAKWAFVVGALSVVGVFTGYTALFSMRVLIAWALATPLVLVSVHLVTPALAPYLRRMQAPRKAVIVGASEVGRRLAQLIRQGEAENQWLAGYFDDRTPERLGDLEDFSIIGRISDVCAYVKAEGIHDIYIALPMASQPRILALLDDLRDTTASVHFVPDIFVADLIQARVDIVAGVPIVAVCESPFHGITAGIKRAVDLAVVIAALPVVAPLMGLIALLIRLTSSGPVFFKQRRYGLDGQEILVWKFRSMKVMEDGDKAYRQVTRDDDRVTPIGKVLRKTSLDELPQLINVLMGNMSLVGPRPHAVAVNEQFRKLIPGYMIRHKVKPGITGWAQVNGYRGGDDLPSMQKRIEFDLDYLRTWNIGLDALILWKTFLMLVRGDDKAF